VSDTALTIPYKTASIEVSFSPGGDDGIPSDAYATLKAEAFTHKRFGIFYWKELYFRPALLVGSRLDIFEDELGNSYRVSGDDLIFVETVLTPEIRARLLELEDLRLRVEFGKPHGAFTLSRERGWLTVSAQGSSGIFDKDYDAVMETAIMFYERLEEMNRQG
jgi:hypothetical protein